MALVNLSFHAAEFAPELAAAAAPARRSGYSQVLAVATMELSALVYSPESEWVARTAERGWTDARMIAFGDSQAAIAQGPDVVVVAFRGSSEANDWRDDFTICPVGWSPIGDGLDPVGAVCKGFRSQAERLIQETVVAVQARLLRTRTPRVVLTGHSLGAALAPLLAVALEARGVRVSAVYVHESPRWCTTDAASWYNDRFKARTFRVVTVERGCQDIVTRVPWSRLGFAHVGIPEIIVDGVLCESEQAWEKLRSDHPVGWVEGWRVLRRAFDGVHAHLSASVLKSLREIRAATPPPLSGAPAPALIPSNSVP